MSRVRREIFTRRASWTYGVRVAFATFDATPGGWVDDHRVAALVGAEYRVWNDPAVAWRDYDRVILRSVWDYIRHAGELQGESSWSSKRTQAAAAESIHRVAPYRVAGPPGIDPRDLRNATRAIVRV